MPGDLWVKNDIHEWLKKYLGKERKIFFWAVNPVIINFYQLLQIDYRFHQNKKKFGIF